MTAIVASLARYRSIKWQLLVITGGEVIRGTLLTAVSIALV
jgi:hypothetical protein